MYILCFVGLGHFIRVRSDRIGESSDLSTHFFVWLFGSFAVCRIALGFAGFLMALVSFCIERCLWSCALFTWGELESSLFDVCS